MTAAVRDAGGVMSEEDLARYHGKIEEPASAPYRGYTVYKAGFWNQGPRCSRRCAFSRASISPHGRGSADALHTIVEAIKLAYADRDRYYGDPTSCRCPATVLLSAAYAAAPRADRSEAREPRAAARRSRARHGAVARLNALHKRLLDALDRLHASQRDPDDTTPPRRSSTRTATSFCDAELRVAARRRVRRRGYRRADEQPDAGVPPRSGEPERACRRQASADHADADMVLKDGKPFLAIGTPGGDSQDQQILLVLLNIIDFGMDVQAAIEAPRVNSLHPQSSFDNHRAQPGVLEVERTLAPPVLEELYARGHVLRVRELPSGSRPASLPPAIDPATGRLRGGADLRRERALIAC